MVNLKRGADHTHSSVDINGTTILATSVVGKAFDMLRASGRTQLMLNLVETGDKVVVSAKQDRSLIQRGLLERNVDAEVVVCAGSDYSEILGAIGRNSHSNIWFDHYWVETQVLKQINRVRMNMDAVAYHMQRK